LFGVVGLDFITLHGGGGVTKDHGSGMVWNDQP
jgi:hypothetical protein